MFEDTPWIPDDDGDDVGSACLAITVGEDGEIGISFGYEDEASRLLLIAAMGDALTQLVSPDERDMH